jgi:hypothetical protein
MEAWADSKHLRCALRILVVTGAALAASACLPGDQAKSNKSDSASFGFAQKDGGDGPNRSGKRDPLLDDIADAAQKLFDSPASTASRKSGQETAALVAPTTNDTPQAAGAADAPLVEDIPETPANVALSRFFSALAKVEARQPGKIVTILHLGDSHISADRFSGDLREQFQSRFGDAGRGMLMPGLYLADGVKFDRGGEWQAALSTGSIPGPYGLTGAKLSAKSTDAWLRLTTKTEPFAWVEITLQSGPEQGTAQIGLDGEVKQTPMKAASSSWRNIRIDRKARELLIRPQGDGQVTVHSISIGTDKPGLRYINLGLPGATAMTPLTWNRDYVAGDLNRLAPDLIVFSYGTDESFDDRLNMGEYEAKVSASVARLRQSAPQAALLIIGPPDVARMPKFASGTGRASDVCRALSSVERSDYVKRVAASDPRLARWHPPLNLDGVRTTLRRVAAAHQAFFWDWAKPMGGSCGVHAWVHSKPALATNDHIHLTEEGSKRSARILFRELMNAYDAFSRTASVGK